MTVRDSLTFVGFGFGPIQAGLFLLEAFRSGNFRRMVVAEVLPDIVRSVREEGGKFHLNIAHEDRIETVTLGPVELQDPAVDRDRERLVDAVAEASEIATAVPSVRFYKNESPGSIHRVLARGLLRRLERSPARGPVVIYAAENHNRAAEILEEAVFSEIPKDLAGRVRANVRFLNTVIGKMSGVIADTDRVQAAGLRTMTSRDPRALLVERFNRILISRLPRGFHRGIEVFEEKDDLLPFEEAKLYGHNAAHSLAAYLAARLGLVRLEELGDVPGAVDFVFSAFLEESGEPLIRKWQGLDDLFTPQGYRAHAQDLMKRMLNPNLGDLVERVARDPERKLGWEDRLVGTMRLAIAHGVVPRKFALGAAAAVAHWKPDVLRGGDPAAILEGVWRSSSPERAEAQQVLTLVREGLEKVRAWESTGIPPF